MPGTAIVWSPVCAGDRDGDSAGDSVGDRAGDSSGDSAGERVELCPVIWGQMSGRDSAPFSCSSVPPVSAGQAQLGSSVPHFTWGWNLCAEQGQGSPTTCPKSSRTARRGQGTLGERPGRVLLLAICGRREMLGFLTFVYLITPLAVFVRS